MGAIRWSGVADADDSGRRFFPATMNAEPFPFFRQGVTGSDRRYTFIRRRSDRHPPEEASQAFPSGRNGIKNAMRPGHRHRPTIETPAPPLRRVRSLLSVNEHC